MTWSADGSAVLYVESARRELRRRILASGADTLIMPLSSSTSLVAESPDGQVAIFQDKRAESRALVIVNFREGQQ